MKPSNANTLYMYAVYTALTILGLLLVFGCGAGHADKPTRDEIVEYITVAAVNENVDPKLALAIALVESELNPGALGGLGEVGVFQLRPEFHPVVKANVQHNVTVAVKYLAQLKTRCGKYGDAFFVCFNYGCARHLNHPRKFPYYVKVMSTLKKLRTETNIIAANAN